jgi:phytoene synthase
MDTIEHITNSVRDFRSGRGSGISPAEKAAIARGIRTRSAPFFWTTWLLPPPRRKAMLALYTFCHEIGEIADGGASRTLKLSLFADWRAQIALLYAGRPQHVIARALDDPVERFDLRCSDFLALINGVEMDACSEMRAPSLEQLDLYCEQTAVAAGRIALRILGAAADCEQVVASLGRGIQVTGILRDLTRDAARRRLYLPRELLQAHGIFATIPSYVLAQPALPHVCTALAENAAMHFADAERAIGAHRQWTMQVANAVLVSYRELLEALLIRGWRQLDEPIRVPARRQAGLCIRCSRIIR